MRFQVIIFASIFKVNPKRLRLIYTVMVVQLVVD